MGGENVGKDGLPEMTKEERAQGAAKTGKLVVGLCFIPVLIGFAIAYAVYTYGGTEAYAKKIALVISNDMHYIYLAAFLISRLTVWLNNFPMIYKARVMTMKSGNLRSNMYIYKEYNSDKIVLLDDGEETGKYNRANRSLHHFTENVAGICCGMVLAGFCFPFPVLVCVCIFSAGRVIHQIGYTSGYGPHAAGFMLGMISGSAIDGMNLLVALKGFGCL